MQTVYVIVVAFSSWDACWDFYYDNREYIDDADRIFAMCNTMEAPADTSLGNAPSTSLRPKSRDDR